MKTLILAAAAALSVAACSAPTSDATTESTADLSSGKVDVDLRTDVTDLQCRILMGSWIQFTYQGHQFQLYGADSLPDCQARLAKFEQYPIHHGYLTRSETGQSAKWSLTLDSVWEFHSYEVLETKSDVTVETALVDVQCLHLKGIYLSITVDGREMYSLPPAGVANRCDAVLAAFNANATHTGVVTLRNEDGGVRRILDLDDSAWQFMSWDSHE